MMSQPIEVSPYPAAYGMSIPPLCPNNPSKPNGLLALVGKLFVLRSALQFNNIGLHSVVLATIGATGLVAFDPYGCLTIAASGVFSCILPLLCFVGVREDLVPRTQIRSRPSPRVLGVILHGRCTLFLLPKAEYALQCALEVSVILFVVDLGVLSNRVLTFLGASFPTASCFYFVFQIGVSCLQVDRSFFVTASFRVAASTLVFLPTCTHRSDVRQERHFLSARKRRAAESEDFCRRRTLHPQD